MGRGYYRKILAAGLFGLSITHATVRGQGPVNFAPGGQMIQPTNGALIRSIEQMTLRAQMGDRDGFVTSVRFYSGANLLGVGNPSRSNEFFMTWTPGRTGNFSLYASAVDNSGATGSTETVQISIATNPPAFSAIEHGSVNSPSAFLFHDGVMIDLNLLIPTNSGWALQTARSINNSNCIVGTGTRAGDGTSPTTRGFLLVPGPMIRVLRATTSVVEGKAYFANGPAVFERSADLIAWVPVSTNDTGAAEAAFSLAVDPSLGAAFYRVVQPSAP